MIHNCCALVRQIYNNAPPLGSAAGAAAGAEAGAEAGPEAGAEARAGAGVGRETRSPEILSPLRRGGSE